MKTCIAFRLAALASSLLLSFNSLHAADATKPVQAAGPAAAPKPGAASAPKQAAAPAPSATSVIANPGYISKPLPVLTLKTDDPWNPNQSNPNWVRVKNESLGDAPAAMVKVTCLDMSAIKFNERKHPDQPADTRCGFIDDFTKPIPALAKGQSADVMAVKPPQLSLGYLGFPYQITFKLQGVAGADLVLSKP